MLTIESNVDHCMFLWFGRVTTHQCRGTYMFTKQFRDLTLSNKSFVISKGCNQIVNPCTTLGFATYQLSNKSFASYFYDVVGIPMIVISLQTTGKHRLTKLTTAQTWGKPPPSPLQYTMCLATRPAPKCHFVLGLPSGSLEILTTWTPSTLGAHNFACRPPIKMKFEEKKYSPCQELSNDISHTTCT